MTLSADEIEALRLVRDLAREALEASGFGRVARGAVRDVRRAYEGLRILGAMIGEGGPVYTPEGHLLTCVRLGAERGWSVEVDPRLRTVTFRGPASFFRLDDILLQEGAIADDVTRVLDRMVRRSRR